MAPWFARYLVLWQAVGWIPGTEKLGFRISLVIVGDLECVENRCFPTARLAQKGRGNGHNPLRRGNRVGLFLIRPVTVKFGAFR